MKKNFLFLSILIYLRILIFSQSTSTCVNCIQTPSHSKNPNNSQPIIYNGNQALATNYTITACGLNYVYASNPLFARTGNNFTLSVTQPASFSISGIPACGVIEKAFLYVATSGDSTAISASIANPGFGSSIFNMAIVGTGPDKNWGFKGSYTYRADVTPVISGNGSYTISGISTSTSNLGNDANGAMLMIIYSDRSQNYTGSIVIADGSLVNATPGGSVIATIGNFDVCGTPTLTSNFMLVDDLQQYGTTEFSFNSAVPNFTQNPSFDQPWSFISNPGNPALNGQTTANFGLINTADTAGIVMAGLYYRTACLVCPEPLVLVAASTPSCLATATVVVSGGVGPYTYTWTGTAQTTDTVSGLSAGTQSVVVSDNLSCLIDTAVFNVVTPAATITASSGTFCVGYNTNLSVGAATSYTWNPSATLNTSNAQNVVAVPLSTTIYTVDYSDAQGCSGQAFPTAFVTLTQTISISNSTLCAGANVTLSTNSFTGDAYFWQGPLSYTSSLQNPVIANVTGSQSGTYNLSVTTIPGCTSTAVSQVTVASLPNPIIGSNAPLCSNSNLNFTGSGASTYSWSGPNGFTSSAQNPTIVAATATQAGTYALTASFGNGCSRTVTSSVVVFALPSPSVVASATNVCVGRSVTFSVTNVAGVSYQWNGPNGFISTLPSPSIAAITLSANGVYTLTVTNGNSCQASTTKTVAALLNPTVSASSPTPCFGAPATLTANGAGFFTWIGPSGYFQQPLIPFTTISVTNISSVGVYTIILTSALNTCSANATTTLSTKPLPIVAATGSLVCLNSPATLTASGGIIYDWIGPLTYTAAGATASVASANPFTTGIYSVVVTAVNTCSAMTTATIGTIQPPTVTATGTTLCLNQPFTMIAGGASSYTWSGPSAYNSIGSAAFVPNVNPASVGTYTVFGRAANSCTGISTSTLATLPLPGIATVGASVCINYAALLQASGGLSNGTGYRWAGPGGFISFAQNAIIPTATNVAPQTYTVVGTSANTCTNTAFATLSTFSIPQISASAVTVCYGYPATITATGANTYTWAGPNSNNFTGSANNFIAIVDSLSRGTYTVYGTSVNGCTNVASVNINTQPIPKITTTSTSVCYLQSATLTASGGVSGSYFWTGPEGFSSNQQNPVINIANNVAPQIYTVTATGLNTCTNSGTAVLNTYPLPQPSYNATSTVCMGSYVTLQALGASSFTWVGPRSYQSFNKDISFPTFDPGQSGTYSLNAIDIRGCKNFTTAVVIINPLPKGDLVSNGGKNNCVPFCSDFRIKRNTVSPILNTLWTLNGNFFQTETFNYCKQTAGTDKVSGQFTDAAGCINTLTFAITSYPTPIANFLTTPEKPFETSDQVFLNDQSFGDQITSWKWSFLKNDSLISYNQNTSYVFEETGDHAIVLNIANVWGCNDSVSKTIKIDTEIRLFIPNAFTPDRDGLNEVFKPKGKGIAEYTLEVFNRRNEKLFESKDFETGWDGTYKGNDCPYDLYVWKIAARDAKKKPYTLTGTVTLLR